MSPVRRQLLVSILLPIALSAVVSIISAYAQNSSEQGARLVKVEVLQVDDRASIHRIEAKLDKVIDLLLAR